MNIIWIVLLVFHLDIGLSLPAKILRYINEQDENGYHFSFNADDSQQREERGILVTKGNEEILVVKGSYTYEGDDGKVYKVDYQADENGYKAKFTTYVRYGVPIPGHALAALAGGGLG